MPVRIPCFLRRFSISLAGLVLLSCCYYCDVALDYGSFVAFIFSFLQVTFIGPPAGPMHALGDKIGSTIIAQSAGVPTIAWNGDDLRVDYQATGIPSEVYDQANVTTAEEALRCADRIGYPVMIKASEGGGGKGIRKVLKSEDVANLFRQVQSEIPGSPVFVMKMASCARHLEVQLLADKHGEAIALSGRDCRYF